MIVEDGHCHPAQEEVSYQMLVCSWWLGPVSEEMEELEMEMEMEMEEEEEEQRRFRHGHTSNAQATM